MSALLKKNQVVAPRPSAKTAESGVTSASKLIGSKLLQDKDSTLTTVTKVVPPKQPVKPLTQRAPAKPGMPSRLPSINAEKTQQTINLYFGANSAAKSGENFTDLKELQYAYTYEQRKILVERLQTLAVSLKKSLGLEEVVVSVHNGHDFILPISLAVPGIDVIVSTITEDVNSVRYRSRKTIVDANLKIAGFAATDDGMTYVREQPFKTTIIVDRSSVRPDSLLVFVDSEADIDEHLQDDSQKWFIVKSDKITTVPEGYLAEIGILQSFSIIYPNVGEYHTLLSELQFTRSAPQNAVRNLSKWHSQIRELLTKILSSSINEKLATSIINEPKYIKLFGQAFTNETINPSAPYDTLAIVGDKVLDMAMVTYLLEKKPDFTAQEITLLKNKYLSKTNQARIGSATKLTSVALVDSAEVGIDVAEDIMESFFGALYMSINHFFGKDGAGMPACYQLFVEWFKDQIDLTEIKIDAYTELKEIYDRLGWGFITLGQNEDGSYYIATPRKIKTYRSGNELFVLTEELGSNETLAETVANSKQAAKAILATEVLKTFQQYGLTTAKAREIHFNNILHTIGRRNVIDKLSPYYQENGFERIEFYEPKKTQNQNGTTITLQLRGITASGSEVVINSIRGVTKDTKSEAQQQLIDSVFN